MRITPILSFLFFSSAILYGQADTLSNHNRKKFQLNPWNNINGIKIAPSFYKNFELEVAYFISSYPELDPGYGGFFQLVQNIGLGVEYINSGNQNAIGGKITYELNYSILSAQVGADVIASDQDLQYRINPRVGLSLFSFVNLCFGWNHNLKRYSNLQTPKYTLTLSANIYDNL